LLADSDGNIDDSCEGDCEGDRCGVGVDVFLGGDSRSVGWLNGSLDCLRFAATERSGCDLVINVSSSGKLWVYVRLLARDCETILTTWWWYSDKGQLVDCQPREFENYAFKEKERKLSVEESHDA
jgi:hypothetical protein